MSNSPNNKFILMNILIKKIRTIYKKLKIKIFVLEIWIPIRNKIGLKSKKWIFIYIIEYIVMNNIR